LVELQKNLAKIEAADIELVAISYDPVDVLKEFAEEKKIGFPLLSDEESKTIKAYGILNEEGKGYPHPGTFILDPKGVVRAKIFLDGYRKRHTASELIEAAGSVK
jgi:peroxiredoxin Q/BCP